LLLDLVCKLIEQKTLSEAKQISKKFVQQTCQRENLNFNEFLNRELEKELEQITSKQALAAFTQRMQNSILNRQNIKEAKTSASSYSQKESNHKNLLI